MWCTVLWYHVIKKSITHENGPETPNSSLDPWCGDHSSRVSRFRPPWGPDNMICYYLMPYYIIPYHTTWYNIIQCTLILPYRIWCNVIKHKCNVMWGTDAIWYYMKYHDTIWSDMKLYDGLQCTALHCTVLWCNAM